VQRNRIMTEENNKRTLVDFEDYEKTKKKKLRLIYNQMNKSFTNFKQERSEHWNLMKNRKADDSLRINDQKE